MKNRILLTAAVIPLSFMLTVRIPVYAGSAPADQPVHTTPVTAEAMPAAAEAVPSSEAATAAPEAVPSPAAATAVPEAVSPSQAAPASPAAQAASPEAFVVPAAAQAAPVPVETLPSPEAAPALPEAVPSPETSPAAPAWTGPTLNRWNGTIIGPSGKETYYNLNMRGIVRSIQKKGWVWKDIAAEFKANVSGEYHIREDGAKMLGNYIMVAANLSVHPRGSLVETSLGTGVVVDTGGFARRNIHQIDIAVNW